MNALCVDDDLAMELGKDGKRMGEIHPRDLRKTDPVPLRVTPAAKPHKKVKKPYGYTFQGRSKWQPEAKWKRKTHYSWYATERQRDDAMKAAGGCYRMVWDIRDVRPVTR